MRPVSAEFPRSQAFGSLATAGVFGDMNGSQVQVLVALYGNYQPYGHAGMDIACPVGTPVHAIKGGTVIWCDWDVNLPGGPNGYSQRWDFYQSFGGRILLLQHGPSEFTAYCHLSAFMVTAGQWVNEGDLIALSGDSSGGQDGVLGPHLHTERLVDLSYSTGNGLIYGREDPEPHFGSDTPQEDELSQQEVGQIQGFTNSVTDQVWGTAAGTQKLIQQVAERLDKGIVISRAQAEDIVAATTARVLDDVRKQTATISAAVGAASSPGTVLDVNALAAQLAPLLNASQADAFMAAFKAQINK